MKKLMTKLTQLLLTGAIIGSLLLLEACCGGITGIAPSTTPITADDNLHDHRTGVRQFARDEFSVFSRSTNSTRRNSPPSAP